MKITMDSLDGHQQQSLIEPRFEDVTRKPDPGMEYTREQVTPYQGDPNYLAIEQVIAYAKREGYTIVPTIKEALIKRQQKQKVLSLREADTAARADYRLSSPIAWAALHTFIESERVNGEWTSKMAAMIQEDIAGPKDSVFELRAFYNRGIAYFKSDKCRNDPPEKVKNARKAMDDALDMLDFARVPAWPEEVEKGFPVEMCKPDFLTWQQYEDRLRLGGDSLHDFKLYREEKASHDQREERNQEAIAE